MQDVRNIAIIMAIEDAEFEGRTDLAVTSVELLAAQEIEL